MLQLHPLNQAVFSGDAFREATTTAGLRGEPLEAQANAALALVRHERARIAEERGSFARFANGLDTALRTNAMEHMDDPNFPESGKLAIANGLDLLNTVTGSYGRFFSLLEPMLRTIAARTGRAPRVLELAGGSGGFACALAALAAKRGLDLTVTGSDVVPLYIDRAREKAAKHALHVDFRIVDALTMGELDAGAYDIIFIAQSVHHFSPGQLARMVSEASRVATTAFVAVDGYRSLSMLAFVVGTALLSFSPAAIHDAVITARKFYSEDELACIGRLGAPSANVAIGRIWPLNTTLVVRFDGLTTSSSKPA